MIAIRRHIRHGNYVITNQARHPYTQVSFDPWPSWTRHVNNGSLMTTGR